MKGDLKYLNSVTCIFTIKLDFHQYERQSVHGNSILFYDEQKNDPRNNAVVPENFKPVILHDL